MGRDLIVACLLVAACKQEPEEKIPDPRILDDPEIKKAIDEVMNSPAQPVGSAARAAAKDPTPVVGEWKIRNMQGSINGKLGALDEPIVPGSWVLGRDGSYKKTGGNELTGTFVFTGTRLVISALGEPLDYEIKKLTPKEMILVHRIEGAGIENTTMFDKK